MMDDIDKTEMTGVGFGTSNDAESTPDKSSEVDELITRRKRLANAQRGYRVPEMIFARELSTDTLEVLECFGVEAPALLNSYAFQLEDVLVKVIEDRRALIQRLEQLAPADTKAPTEEE